MSSIPPGLTPQAFVDKWRHVEFKEHFLDLSHLIGHPTPAEDDPTGEHFAFEYGLAKQDGGQGFTDVFKRGYFGWEYKGKHANLDKAYGQLLHYRSDLLNPPLLVVCDMYRIIIHTNFTNAVHQVYTIALNDLLTGDGLHKLRAIFTTPDFFKAAQTIEQVTQAAAAQFAQLADRSRQAGTPPQDVAHFFDSLPVLPVRGRCRPAARSFVHPHRHAGSPAFTEFCAATHAIVSGHGDGWLFRRG